MTLEEGVNNRVLESNHSIVGFALLADAIDVKYQDIITHSASRRSGQNKHTAPSHHCPEEQPSQNEDH